MSEALLSVRGLKVAYGGIHAVRGIDFEVAAGELVCLIGANGAGKSSTLKGLMGLVTRGGEVRFDGERLRHAATHGIVARGLALVPEGRGIFGRLTVAENLDMGAYIRRDKPGIRADRGRAYELFPRLAERRTQLAGTLSGGEQQMLAMARAMMGRPRLPREQVIAAVTPAMRTFLTESRRLSNHRIKTELRFRLRYPAVMEGLRG